LRDALRPPTDDDDDRRPDDRRPTTDDDDADDDPGEFPTNGRGCGGTARLVRAEPPPMGGMSRGRASPPIRTLRIDSVFHRSVATALAVI
jgi:hypothetical protein